MTVALSCWPGIAGVPPSWPTATCAFCARIAAIEVAGRELVGVELVRVEPDAHRVLGAEHLDAADARHARLSGSSRLRDDVVGDVVAGSCCRLSETKPSDHQEAGLALLTLTPCCCTTCGSSGIASCSLFCTCTCAMSGSVPFVEGQR